MRITPVLPETRQIRNRNITLGGAGVLQTVRRLVESTRSRIASEIMPNGNSSISSSAAESLLLRREHVSTMLQKVDAFRWDYDADSDRINISNALLDTRGIRPHGSRQLTMEQWYAFVHPDDVPYLAEAVSGLLAGESETFSCVYRLRTEGTYLYFRDIASVEAKSQDGRIIRISGILQNINEQVVAEERLHRKDVILEAVAKCASMLLNATQEDFDKSINEVLAVLGLAAQVDRVYIWKNHVEEKTNRLRAVQVYEWSPNVAPTQGTDIIADIDYDTDLAYWKTLLTNGECVNDLAHLMPPSERNFLESQGIVSLLIAPIIYQDHFWGFIGFDDCRNERTWDESETEILRSTGLMIASAIMRQETEKKLFKEQQQLDRFIETCPVIMLQSRRNVIERLNQKAIETFSLQVGQDPNAVYGGKTARDAVLEIIKLDGKYEDDNFILVDAHGKKRNFIATIFIIDAEEELTVGWFVDITEIRKIESDLIKARNDANAATNAKSEFLARMSHEIRTPMNAILGITYLCLQTNLSDKQRDYLLKTQTAANNLLGIINDILDFSKIEAGKIELERTTFSLSDVLSELRDVIELNAKDRGLQLVFDVAPDVVNDLVGDPLRLRQILLNLLSNAIKFTANGSVTLAIKPLPPVEGKHPDLYQLDFSIIDTGIGLKAEQTGKIFDSFVQADSSTIRKYGGTGLGLSIVKRLVELMDGKIDVTSEFGSGTTFHFTAYFIKATDTPDASSAILLNHRRILVVDDEPETREVIIELVRSLNLQADAASSGQEALEKLTLASRFGNPYELVMMDWRMPRMDGIETIRAIHAQEDVIVPPHIVMISAYDRQDCLRQTQGLNVMGVIEKPVKLKDLKGALKTAFRDIRRSDENVVPEHRAEIRGAKILLAEDNKINQLVAAELLKMHGVDLIIANDGNEAVRAVEMYDFDLILMDVQMPELDGLAAARLIRKLPKPGIAHLPILAMTANALDTDYKKSLDAGMNDHLTKPIDPQKLRIALEKWLQR